MSAGHADIPGKLFPTPGGKKLDFYSDKPQVYADDSLVSEQSEASTANLPKTAKSIKKQLKKES